MQQSLDSYIRIGNEERKEATRLKNNTPWEKAKSVYAFIFIINLFYTIPKEGWSHGFFWAIFWPIYWTKDFFQKLLGPFLENIINLVNS